MKNMRVPKRRQNLIGRRGNTQKKTYNTLMFFNNELFVCAVQLSTNRTFIALLQDPT
jgi:hypothetical protein